MRGQERKKENESERAETAAKGGKKKLSLSLAALTFFPDVEQDLDVVAGHPGAAAASICVWIFFFWGGGGSIGGKGEPLRFVRMGFRGPELQPFHLFELCFSRPRFPLSLSRCLLS